jgi:uncharacterized SAM-binding protein YcdF (DUF218 family)
VREADPERDRSGGIAHTRPVLAPTTRADVRTLWEYHRMHHEVVPADVGIGLGSHDLGVATYAAELYRRRIVPRLVFTGANSPTTAPIFPRGEAVHYREHAIGLGVPAEAIVLEPEARNAADNLRHSRRLLAGLGVTVGSVLLICRPYQQRRAWATCRRVWPEVTVRCASAPLTLDEYVEAIGDPDRVITMLVGDTQRIWVYAQRGWAIEQPVPEEVRAAYERLVAAGHTGRLID